MDNTVSLCNMRPTLDRVMKRGAGRGKQTGVFASHQAPQQQAPQQQANAGTPRHRGCLVISLFAITLTDSISSFCCTKPQHPPSTCNEHSELQSHKQARAANLMPQEHSPHHSKEACKPPNQVVYADSPVHMRGALSEPYCCHCCHLHQMVQSGSGSGMCNGGECLN